MAIKYYCDEQIPEINKIPNEAEKLTEKISKSKFYKFQNIYNKKMANII